MFLLEAEVVEPFGLYRIIVTLVLCGIWIYTLVETVIFLKVTVSKRRTPKVIEGGAQSAESTKLSELNAKFVSVGRKLAVVKALDFFSWSTFRHQWRAFMTLIVLAVLNAFALYFFYSM